MWIEETERTEFSIGELAREFDVTPRAIRFYEAEGLISPRRDGQRRIYAPPRGEVVKAGRTLTVARAEVYAEDGTHVASMQQTLMMLPDTPDTPEP